MAEYASREYWEQRYAMRGQQTFDWYARWDQLDADVMEAIPSPEECSSDAVVVVGCGSSALPFTLYDARAALPAFKRRPPPPVIGLDWATSAIEAMSQRLTAADVKRPGLSFAVGDVKSMPWISDGSIAAVVDKATIDAAFCGEDAGESAESVRRVIREIYRILCPGGVLLHVTYSPATDGHRKVVFDDPVARWRTVSVVTIGGDEARPAMEKHYLFILKKP
jgi:SAM-dependent methyltransferase